MKLLLLYISLCLVITGTSVCQGSNNKLGEKADCQYTEVKVNDANGSSVKKMEWELLVNHLGSQNTTSGKPQIDDSFAAYAHLVNYNNSIVLYLRMEILSSQAKEHYGYIFEGDKLLLKLSNEDVVTLEAGKSELGNVRGSATSYSIFYPIDAELIPQLTAREITKARIHWSKGYMDYPIINNDFFVRQLACLE